MSATPIATFTKDPNETLDYTIDWSEFLGLDRISSVTWTIPAGISNAGTTMASKTTTVWLSGGAIGTNYTITAKIVTVGGRTVERSIQINGVDK